MVSDSILVACGTTSVFSPLLTEIETGTVSGHVYVGLSNPSDPSGPAISTGTALAGAGLTLDEVLASTNGVQPTTGTSGADGSYSYSQVPVDTGNQPIRDVLNVSGPSPAPDTYPLGFWPSDSTVTISAGSTTTHDFALIPVCTGTLTATVYSQETGLPLDGATVNDGATTATTDGTGTAVFPGPRSPPTTRPAITPSQHPTQPATAIPWDRSRQPWRDATRVRRCRCTFTCPPRTTAPPSCTLSTR